MGKGPWLGFDEKKEVKSPEKEQQDKKKQQGWPLEADQVQVGDSDQPYEPHECQWG